MLGRSPLSELPISAMTAASSGGSSGGGGSSEGGSSAPVIGSAMLGTSGARLGAMLLDKVALPIRAATSALSLGQSASAVLTVKRAVDTLSLDHNNAVVKLAVGLPLTPIMTDSTTPLGVASSSGLFGGGSFPAYRVFDGLNDADHMSVLAASFPCWWQYQFLTQQKVEAFALWGRSDGYAEEMPRNFWLQGSNDGATWDTLAQVVNAANWQVGEKRIYAVTSPGWYTYYRLRITANNGSPDSVSLGELFLYGPPSIVPVMASNTLPAGTASSSDASANAYKAFDNDYHDGTVASQAASFPCWWQYQFTAPTEVLSFALWAPFDGSMDQMPQAFALLGSMDGTAWDTLTRDISTETNWSPGERRHYPLATTGAYRYYRLQVTANNGDATACAFGDLSLTTERIPAVLADSVGALSVADQAASQVLHTLAASSAIVLPDYPYCGQHFTADTTTNLVAGQRAGAIHSFPVSATSSDLVVADTAHTLRARAFQAASALSLYQNVVMSASKRISDPLSLAQSATVQKIGSPWSVSVLGLLDEADAHNTLVVLSATDVLSLVDLNDVHDTHIQADATDSLTLVDGVGVTGVPIRVSATDVLQTITQVYDPDTVSWIPTPSGLTDAASSVVQHVGQGAGDLLSFGHEAHVGLTRASAIPAAATDVLPLGQVAARSEVGTQVDAIQLGDLAAVSVGKPTVDPLTIGDCAVVAVVRLLSAESDVSVEQSFTYSLPLKAAEAVYSPFIGTGTSGNPPPPPATLSGENLPNPSAPGRFTLVYPASGPVTDSLTLRNPEFGDKDRLQFNRVSRETRGGTLIVYADPMWPKIETLVLTISGLSVDQAEALLEFMENHVGQEIGIWDWEQRRWTGIVTNPNDPALEDGRDMFTASLEFEGQLVEA
jgi:hypothetical protein